MTARRALVALAAGLALAGCGSTAQKVSGTAAADGSAALTVPSPGASGDAGLAGPSAVAGGASDGGQTAVAADGTTVAPDGSIVAPDGTVVSPAPGTPAGNVGQAVGVTATQIYVGIVYVTGNDELNRALGNNLTTGDQKADAQAVVDDINAHGGVAGRKLVPVWYDLQSTDARPYAQIDNEACAHFTQDNHVFAVAGDGLTDNFPACILKSGAMMVSSASSIIGPDQAFFNRFPYVFNTGFLTQDRMMAEELRSLVRQDYFSGWNSATGNAAPAATTKLGIISYDTPSWNTPLDHVLLPGLKAAGHPVDPANVERVTYPSDSNQIGSTVAQIQSAVLKFRQNGVTHVVVLDANGSMTLHMLNTMRGQHYYPRLGVNSATGVEVLATQYHEDAASFNGAVGVGWAPILDLPEGQGDNYFTQATKDCISMIEKRTGQHFGDVNAASVALGECDQLYLLADALNSAGKVVTRDTVSAAIEAMHGRFPSAGTRGLFFSPSRHDGIEFGYDMKYEAGCKCVKYVTDGYRIP